MTKPVTGNRAKNVTYMDYQATTPTDPRALEVMLPFFTEAFGNPHSVEHAYGWDAEEAVEIGLVDRLAEPDELLQTAAAVARSMGENPQTALAMTKELLTENMTETSLHEVQQRELRALDIAYESPEHHEAIEAFQNKQ